MEENQRQKQIYDFIPHHYIIKKAPCQGLFYILIRKMRDCLLAMRRAGKGIPYGETNVVRDVSLKFSKTILREWRSRDKSYCQFQCTQFVMYFQNLAKRYCENDEVALKLFCLLFSRKK